MNVPEWAVECFDGFCVEVFDCLLIAPTHAIFCACVAIESIDGLCDSHLGGSHGYL